MFLPPIESVAARNFPTVRSSTHKLPDAVLGTSLNKDMAGGSGTVTIFLLCIDLIKNYLTLQGLRPAAHGAPVRDSVVLPVHKNTENFCTGNTGASHAPCTPHGGRVGSKGGNNIS